MDDFEGVFEKKICRFVGAKCHIKLIYAIYMVQYAIIQHFDQKLQKTENFYLATIFKVKHCMSSYISTFFRKRMSVSMGIIPGPTDF